MLITNLVPLLSRYSLGFDLMAGPDDTVTLTIIPRKAEGAKTPVETGEVRPILITGTAAEIDGELARGAEGALGQLIAARKTLADQLAQQRQEAEEAKAKAAAKPKAADKSPAKAAAAKPAPAEQPAAPPPPPADPDSGEPVSLW